VIAFYQLGYGVAAFGVGPQLLRVRRISRTRDAGAKSDVVRASAERTAEVTP
jgi:hypothetical protein